MFSSMMAPILREECLEVEDGKMDSHRYSGAHRFFLSFWQGWGASLSRPCLRLFGKALRLQSCTCCFTVSRDSQSVAGLEVAEKAGKSIGARPVSKHPKTMIGDDQGFQVSIALNEGGILSLRARNDTLARELRRCTASTLEAWSRQFVPLHVICYCAHHIRRCATSGHLVTCSACLVNRR